MFPEHPTPSPVTPVGAPAGARVGDVVLLVPVAPLGAVDGNSLAFGLARHWYLEGSGPLPVGPSACLLVTRFSLDVGVLWPSGGPERPVASPASSCGPSRGASLCLQEPLATLPRWKGAYPEGHSRGPVRPCEKVGSHLLPGHPARHHSGGGGAGVWKQQRDREDGCPWFVDCAAHTRLKTRQAAWLPDPILPVV